MQWLQIFVCTYCKYVGEIDDYFMTFRIQKVKEQLLCDLKISQKNPLQVVLQHQTLGTEENM